MFIYIKKEIGLLKTFDCLSHKLLAARLYANLLKSVAVRLAWTYETEKLLS